MWNRKKMKQQARHTVKANYRNIVIVCFIIAFFASGYQGVNFSLDFADEISNNVPTFRAPKTSDMLKQLTEGVIKEARTRAIGSKADASIEKIGKRFKLTNATEGAFAAILDNATRSGSFLVGILSALNQFFFSSAILENTIIVFAAFLYFVYWYFGKNVLLVGERRFFLENKNYHGSEMKRIFFVYSANETLHVSWIMFKKFMLNFLWFFTIIGGFIKLYSYRMIPYILAENPTISSKDVFKLSQAMTKGHKWKLFKLDASFIGWHLLSLLTLGLLRYVYLNPYLTATNTEVYYILRENIIQQQAPLAAYLNDHLLVIAHPTEKIQYPFGASHFKIDTRLDFLEMGYLVHYTLPSLVLIFFSFSFVGWVWEVFLYLLGTGSFINRGTMLGPWLPIYGTGGVAIILLLRKWEKNPLALFAMIMLVCSVLEYATSYLLEVLFNKRWWDYSNYFFNINGRICLESILFFGVGGILFIYILGPLMNHFANQIPRKIKFILCVLLILLFSLDFVQSSIHPNIGKGITSMEASAK